MKNFLFFIFICCRLNAWLDEPTREMREAVRPYLLPQDHPLYDSLEEVFGSSRVSAKIKNLEKGGFYDIDLRKRGVVLARHPKLPGYILKMVVDYSGQSQNKWENIIRGQDEYIEFTGRIRKRNEIQQFIDTYKLDHFITPKKWLYPIPTHVNPPKNASMIKKFYLLVAEDMDIEPLKTTAMLWKTVFDEELINDYFFIATSLNLKDLGPSNQCFTKSGYLAFIDTKDWQDDSFENLNKVSAFFNSEMAAYWKNLLKKSYN